MFLSLALPSGALRPGTEEELDRFIWLDVCFPGCCFVNLYPVLGIVGDGGGLGSLGVWFGL